MLNKSKRYKKNKKGLTFNVLLMILMVILFVMILLFGINKLHLLSNNLSQTEVLKYRNELINSLEYCKNPLNKGSERVEIIKQNKIDMICLLGDDLSSKFNKPLLSTLQTIENGDNNVVFLSNMNYIEVNNKKSISKANVIASFNLNEFDSSKEKTQCFTKNDRGEIVLKIKCN